MAKQHTTKYWSPEEIDHLTEIVYRIRLEDDCPGNVDRMLQKDRENDPNDGGKKLRARSKAYRGAVFATLQALELHQPKPRGKSEA